jgi:putative serine protease PepD
MSDQPTTPPPGHDPHLPRTSAPQGPPPEGPPASSYAEHTAPLMVQERPRKERRTGLAAAVVATALVVGGAAGAGGAATWSALDDEPSGGNGGGTATTSQVVDTPDSAPSGGSVEAVADEVLPSVVKIDVTGGEGAGSGSGIILSSDGEILTNEHVVALAEDGGTLSVSFNDGSTASAEILGTDALTDTAVIKAEGVSDLTPATIGKSGDLRVGQGVVAIGSPFGLDSTVTSGIVSALDRPVNVGSDDQGNSTTYPAIQTDAAINPGNSGGALVDLDGNVVGINSSIRSAATSSGQGGSIGLGFAIPMDEIMPIVDQMRDGEAPTHARMGISVSDASGQQGDSVVPGAQVQAVTAGSSADDAGLGEGDVITRIDDHLITGADSLVATIRSYRPGDEVTVTYVHDGKTTTVDLELDSDASASSS